MQENERNRHLETSRGNLKNDCYKKWRSDWLTAITKTRVVDKSFKELIAKDRVYTCERHFASDDIEICKYVLFVFSFATRC